MAIFLYSPSPITSQIQLARKLAHAPWIVTWPLPCKARDNWLDAEKRHLLDLQHPNDLVEGQKNRSIRLRIHMPPKETV